MSTATKARTEDAATMAQVLQRQKAANIREGAPGAETRIDRIDRCIKLLIGHETQIVKALNEDFGNRAAEVSGITDVAGSIGPLKYAKAGLRAWMTPRAAQDYAGAARLPGRQGARCASSPRASWASSVRGTSR